MQFCECLFSMCGCGLTVPGSQQITMYFWKKKEEKIPTKDYEPRAEGTAARFLYVVTDHFWQLLWANILCVLFCLPLFTIPASLTALHAVIQQYFRKGYGEVWPTFSAEFKTDFLERTFAGFLPFLAALVVGLILYRLETSVFTILIMALALVFMFSVYGWYFPQLPLLKLTGLQALKNALLLMMIETKRSILFVAIKAVILTLMVLFYPFTLAAFLFLVPIVPALLIESIAWPKLEEHLVRE